MLKQHFKLGIGRYVKEAIGERRTIKPVNEDPAPAPSGEEVKKAIHKLENNKSAGSDDLPVNVKLFNYEGDVLVGCIITSLSSK